MLGALRNSNPEEVIQALIDAGADVNAKEMKGSTALMIMAAGNNAKVVNFLLNAGADIFLKDNKGRTVLDYIYDDSIKKIILNAAR